MSELGPNIVAILFRAAIVAGVFVAAVLALVAGLAYVWGGGR